MFLKKIVVSLILVLMNFYMVGCGGESKEVRKGRSLGVEKIDENTLSLKMLYHVEDGDSAIGYYHIPHSKSKYDNNINDMVEDIKREKHKIVDRDPILEVSIIGNSVKVSGKEYGLAEVDRVGKTKYQDQI